MLGGFEWVQLEKGKAVIRLVLMEEPIPAVIPAVLGWLVVVMMIAGVHLPSEHRSSEHSPAPALSLVEQ